MAKITLEQIKQELELQGWQVESTEYKNLGSELIVQCPEGHSVYSTWERLRKELICPVCKQNKYKENTLELRPRIKGKPRIIALDQASHKTGFSVYDGNELIFYGVFNAPGDDETARIDKIKNWVLSMVENWKPDQIAIEGIQYEEQHGVTTFQSLARLQGVLMNICYSIQLPCKVVSSNTWRHYCKVKGQKRSDRKRSAQLLIKDWYDITVTDDEADAICLGKYAAECLTSSTKIENWE